MSRSYTGIGLNTIQDRAVRSALQSIDTYLRDVSADLSMSTGATGTISTALDEPYLVVGTPSAILPNARQPVFQTPLSASDSGPGGSLTVSTSFATPGLTLGTANAAGANNQPIRSDATILAFDATVPAALATAAAAGSAAVTARRDHVHLFPTTLQSTGTVNTLALTAVSATESTLTSSVVTCNLAGATAFRPSATNTITLGAATRRWLQVYVGSSGIASTGGYTQSGTGANTLTGNTTMQTVDIAALTVASLTGSGAVIAVDGDMTQGTPGAGNLGSSSQEWGDLWLYDDADPFGVQITMNSTTAMSADRTLTVDVDNGSRTLKLTGNLTANQDVSTAGSPEFVAVHLNDSASAFRVTLQATGTGMSADRALTVDLGNAARTLTLGGNLTTTAAVSLDQSLLTTSTPQFARIGIGVAAHASVLLAVDDLVSAPSTNLIAVQTNRYGGDGNYLGDPTAWLQIRSSGSTYKIPLYA